MVKVKIPATTANMGPGFDTLGMALDLYNYVEMQELDTPGLTIEVEGLGADFIPKGTSNLVYHVAQQVFERVNYQPQGLAIRLTNYIPVASGLGSSATAIVGGLVGANALAGNPLGIQEILTMATDIEGHPDNVAPALLGGMIVSAMDGAEVRYVQITPPPSLACVIATPNFPLSTKAAREVLPQAVSMHDAVFNISHTAVMVAALAAGNIELFGQAMQDKLHEPYRCALIPGMQEVLAAVKSAGAKGVALSGAGPTLIAYTAGEEEEIAKIMKATFLEFGVESKVIITKPINLGATVMA